MQKLYSYMYHVIAIQNEWFNFEIGFFKHKPQIQQLTSDIV